MGEKKNQNKRNEGGRVGRTTLYRFGANARSGENVGRPRKRPRSSRDRRGNRPLDRRRSRMVGDPVRADRGREGRRKKRAGGNFEEEKIAGKNKERFG